MINRKPRGSVLVEFAIVVVVLYFIFAAILTFGRAMFAAQVLQQSADLFARELSRTPLPPADDLYTALADPAVQPTLFNEASLEIDISPWIAASGGQTLDQYLQYIGTPLVNRMLAPLMIIDQRASGTFLWYPGATLDPATGHYEVSVLQGDGSGPPISVPVVEPAGSPDPFALTGAPGGGLAAIRLNYPFQSESLTAVTTATSGNTVINTPIIATGEAADFGPTRGGLYGGPNHLGQQAANNTLVRPFQRLLSCQGVYRREVFR